ncbi:MAG TPA: glycine cleavage system protein GcvH [Nevskiaceae bacterium]|nr:glycine cleavage system protein GcvH [Nevskiaceae bacterium]
MSNIPASLKYVKSHEWVKKLDDGTVMVGITDHAQEALGDLVYAEPPAVGRKLGAEEACAVLESVKAASDVYAPIAGEVTESNAVLADKPELLNEDPYGQGWLWKMRPAEPAAVDALLDAKAYEAVVAAA